MLAPLSPTAVLWAECGRSTAAPPDSGSVAPALHSRIPDTQRKTAVGRSPAVARLKARRQVDIATTTAASSSSLAIAAAIAVSEQA